MSEPRFISRMETLAGQCLVAGVRPPQGSTPGSCRVHALTLVSLPTGMCLQAFVEAFFYLAQRKFKMLPLHKQVASLIDLCEYHLSLLDEKRLVCGRSGRPGGRPPYSSTPQEATPADPPAEGGLRPCTAKLSHPRHTPA